MSAFYTLSIFLSLESKRVYVIATLSRAIEWLLLMRYSELNIVLIMLHYNQLNGLVAQRPAPNQNNSKKKHKMWYILELRQMISAFLLILSSRVTNNFCCKGCRQVRDSLVFNLYINTK